MRIAITNVKFSNSIPTILAVIPLLLWVFSRTDMFASAAEVEVKRVRTEPSPVASRVPQTARKSMPREAHKRPQPLKFVPIQDRSAVLRAYRDANGSWPSSAVAMGIIGLSQKTALRALNVARREN
ncbi:hypothetical protein [Conyzicola sp.]|uniref:hypothetical protein n=1 Tax=Conyzicola sp. TaxID=1969404 RepID=UPI0039897A76